MSNTINTNFSSAQTFAEYGLNDKGINRESASGGGSSIRSTEVSRDYIVNIIKKYNVKSILDLGCGDWHWMSLIRNEFPNTSYEGWDVSERMISDLNNKYGDDNTTFYVRDIITDKYPSVDMIICRDVLFHLKPELTQKVLKKIKNSKTKYFLTTSFNDVLVQRKWIEHGMWSGWGFYEINLNIEPFNLKDNMIESVYESTIQPNSGFKRYLNLYNMKNK